MDLWCCPQRIMQIFRILRWVETNLKVLGRSRNNTIFGERTIFGVLRDWGIAEALGDEWELSRRWFLNPGLVILPRSVFTFKIRAEAALIGLPFSSRS